jgi:hypothetical protein
VSEQNLISSSEDCTEAELTGLCNLHCLS